MRWICAPRASHIDDTARKSTRAVEEIWTKNEQYPPGKGEWRETIGAHAYKCTKMQMHRSACTCTRANEYSRKCKCKNCRTNQRASCRRRMLFLDSIRGVARVLFGAVSLIWEARVAHIQRIY